MSEPFLGEIVMFGGNFAPRNWALCNGQLLAISQNAALFSILGTTYGGNGTSTFALPNMQCRIPIHPGTAGGLDPVVLGEFGGVNDINLTLSQMPIHNHQAIFTPTGGGGGGGSTPAQVNVTSTVGTLASPVGNMLAQSPASGQSQALVYAPASSTVAGQLAGVSGGGGGGITGGTVTVGNNGGSLPVNIENPYLAVNFIIATQGIFPSRN